MRNAIITLLILQPFFAIAQNLEYLKPLQDLIPKTPEAAALSKFVDIPPGNYTGTSSFSVPIHTISTNGISLPISIDYHASGVKVGDVSSRIGLGWVLNIGGLCLSKQIVGMEDTDHILNYDVINFDPSPYTSDNDYFTALTVHGCDGLTPKDTQPDIYTFSINGESGQFVIDSANKIHQIPYGPTKIDRTTGLGFMFTNTSGVKFKFLRNGIQYTRSGEAFISGHTSFKITEIEFLNGEKILFNYRATGIAGRYMTNRMTSEVISMSSSCSDSYGVRNYELNASEVYEGLLTSIVFDQGTLHFKYSDEKPAPELREDMVNDVYCYSIQLKNANNLLLKDFSLNQTYFISPGYVADETPTGFEMYLEPMRKASYYRLKLDSIIENNSTARYSFEYHQEHDMPHRLSFDTDYWGFYNGANNSSDMPRILFNNRFVGEADKHPDSNYGKTAALRKVILPTGGYQEFFYENDDFYYDGVIENYTPNSFEIDTENGANFNHDYFFTLNGDVDQVLEFTATPNPLNAEPENNSLPELTSYIYGVVFDQNHNVIARVYLNGEKKVVLPHNQTCYLRIIKVGSDTFSGSLKLKWYVNNSYTAETNKTAGTLRINKIILNDGNSNSIVRKFEYKNPVTHFSSGYNHGDELIPYTIVKTLGNNTESSLSHCYGTCEKTVLSNNSGIRLNVVNGKSVGYDYVKEIYHNESNPAQNHYTLLKYSNEPDTNQMLMRISPIVPREDNSFMRGLLLQKRLFDNAGQEKRKDTFTYEFDPHFNTLSSDNYGAGNPLISALKIDMADHCIIVTSGDVITGNDPNNPNIITSDGVTFKTWAFAWREYQINSAWVKMTKEETEAFFSTGTVYTKKEYAYNTDYNHIFPKVITSTTSDSAILDINKNYYPQDIEMSGEPFVSGLISQNQVNKPIVTQTFKGAQKLAEKKTVYSNAASPSNLILPKYIYAKKGEDSAGSLEKKITFNSYDNKGNITQYTLENDSPVSLIWGYNKTQPVAKIENCAYNLISSGLITAIQDASDTNNNEAILITALNALRSALGESMVTTYTYIPLVGVSTITDPKGDVITYEYDSFQRLKAAFDKNGNKLSENEYHYKSQ